MKAKRPYGPPMTLGNMRQLGVQRLIASCLNPACRHTALIEVWSYPADTEIPYFKSRVVCAKCGSRRDKIDVRPNWKEQTPQASLTGKQWR
jgi:Zn ribbon nucleic-acid-binding protein